MEATRYLSMKDIGKEMGVSAATVSKWRTRYADTDHPTPEPTAWTGDPNDGGTPGWDNTTAWQAWKETLPGRGAGGGPLPLGAAAQELARALDEVRETAKGPASRMSQIALHRVAARYGVDVDTIMAVWSKLADENPSMPNDQLDQRAVATIMRGRKPVELGRARTSPE